MLPRLPILDARNNALAYIVVAAYCGLRSIVLSNVFYLFVCQLRHWAAHTFMRPAKLHGVSHVTGSGIPSKIANVIVCSIAVFVAAINFSWHWLVEGGQNQSMNSHFEAKGVADSKINMEVAVFAFPWFDGLAFNPFWATTKVPNNSVLAANIAKIRHGVRTLKAGYLFPNFHNSSFFDGPLCHKKGDYSGS